MTGGLPAGLQDFTGHLVLLIKPAYRRKPDNKDVEQDATCQYRSQAGKNPCKIDVDFTLGIGMTILSTLIPDKNTGAVLSAFLSLTCSATEISCPQTLPETIQRTESIDEGWEARQAATKHLLTGFEVTFGHPSLSDGAIYDQVKKTKESGQELETLVWDIRKIGNPYVTCSYSFTAVTLVQSVEGASTCEMRSIRKNSSEQFGISSAVCF